MTAIRSHATHCTTLATAAAIVAVLAVACRVLPIGPRGGGGSDPWPDRIGDVFATGFEYAARDADDFRARGWNYVDVKPGVTQPGGARLETVPFGAGPNAAAAGAGASRALRCYVPTARFEGKGSTSKAMVAYKGPGLPITRGMMLTIRADFYSPSRREDGAPNDGRVTIFDLEDNRTGNAGLRFQFEETGGAGRVTFNPDKIGRPVVKRAARIPKDRWFAVAVEVVPGEGRDGRVRIWVDDGLVLDERTPTILSRIRGYTTIQAGITARLRDPYLLYMDNFAIHTALPASAAQPA